WIDFTTNIEGIAPTGVFALTTNLDAMLAGFVMPFPMVIAGFVAKMFSQFMDAVSVFDNEPFFNKLGFSEITEIFYDLTKLEQSRKMLFNYALLGRRGKEGLLQTLGGGRLTKSAIFVPSTHEKEAENFIKKWNVEYLKKRVFILGG
ncbi:MAG: hypothetical protein QXD02_01360, partial [Candidatus Parvarchaeum sp.]|nr:hypothetical protein [Candidatus Parvarchaeum tengchongense]